MSSECHAVTGAFGYSGKYIAQNLLAAGHKVVTFTNSTHCEESLHARIRVCPFHFERPERLIEDLRGVEVLYNTYWIRFNHRAFSHAEAVRNTCILFEAAKKAGVARIVHISVTNPSVDSDLEYFRGKGELELLLKQTGISHSILRPTVLFGKEDILINNIAWMLRRFPAFGVFGDGEYRLQPIYVNDLAELAVSQGAMRDDTLINAIGPETFTYRQLVEAIGRIIGKRRPIFSISSALGYYLGVVVGKLVGDVLVTREEIKGLMRGLLYVDAPPAGKTRLTEWAQEHRDGLGARYASELKRRLVNRL
jgi:nucleoside-diphosphate-sugar epimerase